MCRSLLMDVVVPENIISDNTTMSKTGNAPALPISSQSPRDFHAKSTVSQTFKCKKKLLQDLKKKEQGTGTENSTFKSSQGSFCERPMGTWYHVGDLDRCHVVLTGIVIPYKCWQYLLDASVF